MLEQQQELSGRSRSAQLRYLVHKEAVREDADQERARAREHITALAEILL